MARDVRTAAVEVLAGRSDHGAQVQVDHAVANFHTLKKGAYSGALFAVFDERTKAADRRFREQFNAAKPDEAELVASSEAPQLIAERLKAA